MRPARRAASSSGPAKPAASAFPPPKAVHHQQPPSPLYSCHGASVCRKVLTCLLVTPAVSYVTAFLPECSLTGESACSSALVAPCTLLSWPHQRRRQCPWGSYQPKTGQCGCLPCVGTVSPDHTQCCESSSHTLGLPYLLPSCAP